MSLDFLRAGPRDAARLAELDAECFEKPWPQAIYRAELCSSRSIVEWCFAAPHGRGEPLGWLVQWVVGDESQVLRVATRPAARRQGVARSLLERAVQRARCAKCAEILLEVGSTNERARSLYASAGFETIGLRKGYYSAPRDDAVVMRRRLGPSMP